MNIAAITITLNDYHCIEQWKSFYNEYISSFYKHIIVDNNSDPDYKFLLHQNFPQSIIIERQSNGGTTAAYNDGIKCALKNQKVDSIMLIANDIKINRGSIEILYKLLFDVIKIGAVSPVLLEKDGKTIIAYGENLKKDMGLIRLYHRKKIEEDLPELVECQCLPGGINLIHRKIYENVGLQDESLFMYMDENDFFHRVSQKGYRIAATKLAQAAHCHIPTEGQQNDNSLAWFYINRNHILICKKYGSFMITANLIFKKLFFSSLKMTLLFLTEKTFKKIYYYYVGIFLGLIGYKKNLIKKE